MSSTVTYKGSTLTTANNQTRTLETAGKYLEDDITIVDVTTAVNNQNKTVSPTESQQSISADSGYTGLGTVTVNAISSSYIGSGVTQRSSSDLTVSGATVTAPSGYYSSSASESVASGTEGTPTATKGTVSNHSVSVTPSVTNTAGYISGGTHNGTAVSVSASELVSGTLSVTSSGTKDVTNYASASIPALTLPTSLQGSPSGTLLYTVTANALIDRYLNIPTGYNDSAGYYLIEKMPRGTAGTPVATKGTVSNHSVSVTPSVTNSIGYINGGTINGTAVSVSASELVDGTLAVNSAGTKDVTNYASATIPSGTAGTPTATKGSVSNHAVTVTPSVTNTTGFITGSTINGTGVSVSASELVSGSQTITENDTYDVTNLASVVVNVSGGSSSEMQIDTSGTTLDSNTSYFDISVEGEPTSLVLMYTGNIAVPSSGQSNKTAMVVWDGTSSMAISENITNVSNSQVDDGSVEVSYYNNAVWFTNSQGDFPSGTYYLVYTYGGTSGNINTADVQVGSGATSITFTGLEDEPEYWSCIFKSNFSTSSGYQRVIGVFGLGGDAYGLEMDSSAHFSDTHWSYTYNNGSLTITSSGTNAGGYFHQPGYYQLTYAISGDQSLQTKTVTPTTSTQNVTADTGYTALKKVVVNPIPSSYVQPTTTVGATTYRASTSNQTIQSGTYHSAAATIAAVTQTNLTADNIKSGTTISISNGQSNLWSVTGTYTGSGGGGSVNVATTTWTNSSTSTVSHQFTGLSGTPKAAFLRCTTQLTRSSSNTYYYIADIVWDGTNTSGNYHLRSNGSYNNVPSTGTAKYNVTVGTNSITFSSTATSRSSAPGSFYNGTYELVYIY